MNKRLQAFMEAETNAMLDELSQEPVQQAKASETIVNNEPQQIDKSLNQLVEVRIDFDRYEGITLRNTTISLFLEEIFGSEQFSNTDEKRSAWRTGDKSTLIAGMIHWEGITYHGFRFTYTFDTEAKQVVMNFIPADIVKLGGTVPREILP